MGQKFKYFQKAVAHQERIPKLRAIPLRRSFPCFVTLMKKIVRPQEYP